jgi:DnaJ-domain-containing protein 1
MARGAKSGARRVRSGSEPSLALVPVERAERSILLIRGEKVILDADLANLYEVPTKRLNEQVRRNRDRFPPDFMFQLTAREKKEVVANCDHLAKLKFSASLPLAFTEHGAIMAANVLNSPRAIAASVMVVRAFVRLRQILATHADLARKLEELEKRYDSHFQEVFRALRSLMAPPAQDKKRKRIGFQEADGSV